MKKTLKRALALITTAMIMALCLIPFASAANIGGTLTTTFDKYLVMDANANVPNAAFRFSIRPGAYVAADKVAHTPTVNAGLTGVRLVYGSTNAETVDVNFTPTDSTYSSALTGDTVALAAGEKYAKHTVTVDVSLVNFPQPGVYRYIITESCVGRTDGITNDSNIERWLDVYVHTDDAGNLSVAGYVLHEDAAIMGNAGGAYAAKDAGFENTYTTYDLTVTKNITGNQGYRFQYFDFTVELTGAVPGTVYTVNTTAADHSSNPTTLTADAEGKLTASFKLSDDDAIIIYGITAGTSYRISEDSLDYYPSYDIDHGTATESEAMSEFSPMGENDHSVNFTNLREGTVPTGIMLDIAPYAIILLIAIASVAIIIKRRKLASK